VLTRSSPRPLDTSVALVRGRKEGLEVDGRARLIQVSPRLAAARRDGPWTARISSAIEIRALLATGA
jgi:hypothetical protein